ncbi:MAG: HAD family hydrolase [Eubacteriales bacterium]|nr:HAD family hydrolase [Eubacteriales bacterium]
MYKCCLFDLDGTILDTVTTIAHYGNKALAKFNLPSAPVKEYNYFAGDGSRILTERMLMYVDAYDEKLHDELWHTYMSEYDKDPYYLTSVFDGMMETIDTLKSMGVKVGVITNKPQFAAQSVVDKFYGPDIFEICIGVTDGRPTKPDPTVTLEAVQGLGLKPEECVFVGDTCVDIQTGKNAGMLTVGVLWGFRPLEELEQNGADIIAHKPSDILKVFKER